MLGRYPCSALWAGLLCLAVTGASAGFRMKPPQRPDRWPAYLASFEPPAGLAWSSYQVVGPDDMPQVLVPGSPAFWMDLHEVTVGQLRRCCQATGQQLPAQPKTSTALSPAVGVGAALAQAYLNWTGRQVPQAAQWDLVLCGGHAAAPPYGWLARGALEPGAGPPRPVTLEIAAQTTVRDGELVGDEVLASGPFVPVGDGDLNPLSAGRSLWQPTSAHPLGLHGLAGGPWEWCTDGSVRGGPGALQMLRLVTAVYGAPSDATGLRCVTPAPGADPAHPPQSMTPLTPPPLVQHLPVKLGAGQPAIREPQAGRWCAVGEGLQQEPHQGQPVEPWLRLWAARLDAWRSLAEGRETEWREQHKPAATTIHPTLHWRLSLLPGEAAAAGAAWATVAYAEPEGERTEPAQELQLRGLPPRQPPAPQPATPSPELVLLAGLPSSARILHPDQPVTGLVVDALGLGLERALLPSLRLVDGTAVWDPKARGVAPDAVLNHGVAGYASSLPTALALSGRVGPNPMIVRAIGRAETAPSVALLADADGAALRAADRHHPFLKDGKVVFVDGHAPR